MAFAGPLEIPILRGVEGVNFSLVAALFFLSR
jgi:hypothetical protein